MRKLCSCICFWMLSFFVLRAAEPLWVNDSLLLGDDKTESYLPLLKGKRVAVFSNQTGCLSDGTHILDVFRRSDSRSGC